MFHQGISSRTSGSTHTFSQQFSGLPDAMAAGGGTAEGRTTVEAAATAAETAEGVPLGLALPAVEGKIYRKPWVFSLKYIMNYDDDDDDDDDGIIMKI